MNDAEWRAWSGQTAFLRSTRNPGVLTARSADGGRWPIEFAPAVSREDFDVSVALLSRGLESNVRSGENRGRRLQHDFVALGLVTRPMQRVGETSRSGEAACATPCVLLADRRIC